MKKITLFVLFICFISCKKEQTKNKIAVLANAKIERKLTEGKIIKIDTSLIIKFKSDLLIDFYKRNNYETVWQSSDKRNILLESIKNCDDEGLNPQDYDFEKLTTFEKKLDSLTDQDLVAYDLMLTHSFQKYISHLSNGKLNPKKLYGDWDLKQNTIAVNDLLINGLRTDSLRYYIKTSKPNHVVYSRLIKALKIINTFPNDTIKALKFSGKIILNDTNNSLVSIKRKLIYWHDLKRRDTLNSIYDTLTFNSIKSFQLRHGIIADGIIGKGTLTALNYSKNERKKQIIANLERWKWYPKNMGEQYLIVNIPDYKLTVVKNKDSVATHKVIVGSAKRKTPVLSSKLSYAAFNPTWTVPPTIIKEDIIPATSKNKAYLTNKNITVYDSQGNEIAPQNWDVSKAKGYRYVQSPGSYNSLGMVKLIFPNKYSVYLHDTNHRSYFDKTDRSLSSGCVRVQNVLKLAEYLIDDEKNWSEEKITKLLKTKKTTNVMIKKPVMVQQLYWTAWSEGNKLIFRNDIYNLDADLYTKLRN